MREGWFCGPSAPVVLRGRGGEVLVGRLEREVGNDLLLLGQVRLEVRVLRNLCSPWLSGKTDWP